MKVTSHFAVANVRYDLSYNKEVATGQPFLSMAEYDNLVSVSQNANITARGQVSVQVFPVTHLMLT